MKITKISVEGLFGIFDHEIPLNTEERITIIHGLNGFGKTNILRIVSGLINYKYSKFTNIPFNKFKIFFDNNNILEIQKTKIEKKENIEEETLLNFHINNQKTFSYDITRDIENEKYTTSSEFLLNKSIYFLGNAINDNSLDLSETKSRFSELSEEPKWLNKIRNNINIRLIESQRLLDINNRESSSMLSTVSTYSTELAKIMQNKFSEYGKESQSLDRTFPVRAVQKKNITNLTDEKLKAALNDLENMRTHLTNLGLLDKDENTDFPIQLQDIQDIDESTRIFLSLYVKDVKQKLSIFDGLAKKIDLLQKIINHKFSYSYKRMNFSKEQGFIFTTCYPNTSESESKTLAPTDLSSGEQHELVLLYELLFKVEPNSLVLIDEPELSLHVGWQSQFLKDLKEITELADLDILMATHSPDIIQDRWEDLTVELKAPEKQK